MRRGRKMNSVMMCMIGDNPLKTNILKKLLNCCILLMGFSAISGFLRAQNLPEMGNPPRLVNDFAHMLSQDESTRLESKLVLFDDSTTNQIAIVTVDSLGGYDVSDFTIKLFQKWKIGTAKKDNGVLVLVSKRDRKTWITTGRGLEGPIPDAICKRIVDLDIIPKFKQGKYFEGLDLATTELMQRAKGEFHDPRAQTNVQSDPGALFFIILIIIIMIFLFTRGGGNNQIIGGGSPFWWFFLGNMLGSGRGSSWGGNSGGGFGGGDSGGGFGGFSGGDTGGGGAGGSW